MVILIWLCLKLQLQSVHPISRELYCVGSRVPMFEAADQRDFDWTADVLEGEDRERAMPNADKISEVGHFVYGRSGNGRKLDPK